MYDEICTFLNLRHFLRILRHFSATFQKLSSFDRLTSAFQNFIESYFLVLINNFVLASEKSKAAKNA